MKKYAIIFLFLLVLLLLGVSFVAAADTDGQDPVMLENEDMELSQGDNIDLIYENEILESNDNQANLYENEATDEISLSDDSQAIPQSNDLDVLAEDTGTYSGLAEEIGSGGDIELLHAYYTYDFGSTINITITSVIDGKGAIIDMNGSNIRALSVNAPGVTIKNLTIKNANYEYSGGAIYFNSFGTVENCNFINNTAKNYAGAIDFEGNGAVTNCNFINNKAINNAAGAIYFTGSATVENCNFTDNSAGYKGGAVYIYGNSEVSNCNFANNRITAESDFGGAIFFRNYAEVTNCNFTNNTSPSLAGAIYFYNNGTVTTCNFINNSGGYEGGAIFSEEFNLTADTCIFKTNIDTTHHVLKLPPTLNVDNFTTSENSGEKLTFDLKTNSGIPVDDGNISIRLYYKNNDSLVGDYSCLSGEGWAVNLPLGSYYAIFNTEYAGFEPVNKTISIMGMTNIMCSDISVTYDEDEYLIASLKDSSDKGIEGMAITVLLKGVEGNYTTDEEGTIKVPLKGLDVNDYIAEITFDGNDIYNKSSATVNVIVNKANSTLTVDDIELEYGDSTYIIVTPEGAVSISAEIDGVELFVYNYLIIIPKLAVGNHTLSVTTIPDANHNAVTETANVEVINKTPSRLETQIIYENMTTTAVDVDTDGRVGEYFYITLTDKKGNALANKPVQMGFNGNVYDRTTDKDGKAKLQINLKNAGTYTFAVAYLGDDDYNGSFIVAKIVVNKQKGSLTVPNKSYSASANTKTLTATFKSASGKAVKGKKITFTVNGKTYTATTDSKGVAKVNVSLNKKGTYSFTAKFAGNNMYAAISKTGKLTIK